MHVVDLFDQDVAVTSVAGEVVDDEQVDPPEADGAGPGVILRVVQVVLCGDRTGPLARPFELGDDPSQGLVLTDGKATPRNE